MVQPSRKVAHINNREIRWIILVSNLREINLGLGELTKGPWSSVSTKCKWGEQKAVGYTEWLNFFLLQNLFLLVTPPKCIIGNSRFFLKPRSKMQWKIKIEADIDRHTVNRPSAAQKTFSGWVLSAEIRQLPSLISWTILVGDIDGPLTCPLLPSM